MPFRNRLTPDETIEALLKCHGQLSLAGDLLGVSRQAVQNMADRHPRVARAVKEARERMVDEATIIMRQLVAATYTPGYPFSPMSKRAPAGGLHWDFSIFKFNTY